MSNAARTRKSAATLRRRRQRARAARQALRLCEASPPPGPRRTDGGQRRAHPVTARAALRAAGLPPHLAAALRSRLQLTPGQETRQ